MKNEFGNSAKSGALDNSIDYSKKLPDAELEVMMEIWNTIPPVNTAYLMAKIGNAKNWKAPTLISFLVRLEDRGYLISEKHGKERYYTPLADKDTYIKMATEHFVNQYHGGSFVKLIDTLFADKNLSEKDIDDLLNWLRSKN